MKRNTLIPRVRSVVIVATGACVSMLSICRVSGQGLPSQKSLTHQAALDMAHAALEKCQAGGYHVSLSIIDAGGHIKVQIHGDGTNLATPELSRKKAYTALLFRRPSMETAKAWASGSTNPQIEGTVGLGGGLPIKIGNDTIGAIGVAGAPDAEKDEACSAAGIAKIGDLLK